jgi:hypothetical protein
VIRRLITTTGHHHNHPDPELGYGELNPLAALSSTADPGSADNPLLHPDAAPPTSTGHSTALAITGATLGFLVLGIATTVLLRRRRQPSAPPATRQAANNNTQSKRKQAPAKTRGCAASTPQPKKRSGNRPR